MTRYIDADALKEHIIAPCSNRKALLGKWIDAQLTIDVVPVKHGKWANDAVGVLRCSECNTQAPWRFVGRGYNEVDYRWKSDYCPNCGARMNEK